MTKYTADTAAGYEARRQVQPKWKAEDAIIKTMLGRLPAGTTLLDIPVGTGRFIPFYEVMGFEVLGLDISDDMLALARQKGGKIRLDIGDIFATGLEDRSFDVAIAIRIMNKIAAEDMRAALRELQRVARDQIIFNLRVWHPATRFRNPHRIEMVHEALDGWQIAEDQRIHENDFRMLRLVRCAGST